MKSEFKHIDIYRLIFETSTEGILVCDKSGVIVMANESTLTLFGYDKEELINQKIEILLPNNIKKSHTAHRDSYGKSPEKKKMGAGRDLFGLRKDGSKIPLEISLNHMTIEDKFYVMALITDISQRKKQEAEIHELNARLALKIDETTQESKENQILYRLIAKNFPNGIICVLNKELKFTFAEGEELTKSGVKGKFLINKSYLDSFNAENRKEVEKKLKTVFEGNVAHFEINKRKSVYQVHAVPLIYEKEMDVSQVLIVENNVTKTKNIEQKMKESLLKEKELSEMKSQFVSMASHEFRTPLSTILSSVSLIEKYDEIGNNEKKQIHFEKIKKNIKNLTNMLNDTLTISRIEENMTELNFVKFDVLQLLQEIINESDGLRGKNQEISINFVGDREVSTDQKILKVIFSNLISNALKYSEENVILNAISENNNLSVTIIDKGIGIPKKDQERLFERFYRAENVVNIQGTGLGLNIVNSYISVLNGTIEVMSEENEGTTVCINIPTSK